MILTTERPQTNRERVRQWELRRHARKQCAPPMFLREFLTSLAGLIGMGLIVLAIVLIAEWVAS